MARHAIVGRGDDVTQARVEVCAEWANAAASDVTQQQQQRVCLSVDDDAAVAVNELPSPLQGKLDQ